MSRTTGWGWPLVMVFVLSALSGCGGSSPDAARDDEETPEEPAVPVEVAVAEIGTISAAWRGSATLEAEAESDVVARVGGIVETLMVEEGDPVRAGDALAKLDTDQRALELRQAKAELERLRADHDRNKAIFRENLISREVFDRTRFELESAQASYALAQLDGLLARLNRHRLLLLLMPCLPLADGGHTLDAPASQDRREWV